MKTKLEFYRKEYGQWERQYTDILENLIFHQKNEYPEYSLDKWAPLSAPEDVEADGQSGTLEPGKVRRLWQRLGRGDCRGGAGTCLSTPFGLTHQHPTLKRSCIGHGVVDMEHGVLGVGGGAGGGGLGGWWRGAGGHDVGGVGRGFWAWGAGRGVGGWWRGVGGRGV